MNNDNRLTFKVWVIIAAVVVGAFWLNNYTSNHPRGYDVVCDESGRSTCVNVRKIPYED